MAINIGVNGFGRIGRYLVRLLASSPDLNVKVINARADNNTLAHLLKYDSVHGTFDKAVTHSDDGILVDEELIKVTRCPKGEWLWADNDIDIVVETTGTIKDKDGLLLHNKCGAKKTVISAPGKGVDATIVMGVNQDKYDPANHHVISNASCTTNCLAPAAKVINDAFGIKHGLMTTIHSFTMSQRILDGSHKDLRRARAASVSMIPTTTGAAKATTEVIPELKGRLDGMAIRVPTPNVSLVDLTCELEQATTTEEVNYALRQASETTLKDVLGYTEVPLVSVDFNGNSCGGVVDGLCTTVMDKNLLKVIVWYDNEAGFTHQLVRLLKMMARSM